jgi:osmotically-inducible protein OsmY
MTIESRDADLQRQVLLEVNWVPSLRQEHLTVTVRQGVATLSGSVATVEQRQAAEAAVKRIRGVTNIREQIELRPGADAARVDGELRRRALESLRRNVGVAAGAVRLKIERGWITLEGAVDNRFARDAAEIALQSLYGVAGISNHLTLRPPPDR